MKASKKPKSVYHEFGVEYPGFKVSGSGTNGTCIATGSWRSPKGQVTIICHLRGVDWVVIIIFMTGGVPTSTHTVVVYNSSELLKCEIQKP